MQFNGEPHASPEKQKRGTLLSGLGKGCYKGRAVGGNWKFEMSDFSLAELGSLSLAELLLAEEESFLSPTEEVM